MGVAGILALVYPLIASVAIIVLLAWILIISVVVQGIGLIGAQQVPHFWLQLISVVLSIVVGLLLLRQPESGLVVFSVLPFCRPPCPSSLPPASCGCLPV